jgi:hypothetical protein
MASIEIRDGSLVVQLEGLDRLFTMRSSLAVALHHVKSVVPRPDISRVMYMEMGTRFRGVQVPGIVVAGTIQAQDGSGFVFCDVHDPTRAIEIDLENDPYKQLIIELNHETPDEAKERIEDAMRWL